MAEYDVVKTDVLVIGGGGAGVRAAIEADVEDVDVTIVSKGPLARSGTTPLAYPCYRPLPALWIPGTVRTSIIKT